MLDKYGSSSETLDVLNKKFFGSLIVPSKKATYSTAQIADLPELCPELLKDIRLKIPAIDQTIKMDPGINIILQPLNAKTAPASFVIFGQDLSAGYFTFGSFSPRKKPHWIEAKRLITELGTEMDQLLLDFKGMLPPEKWLAVEYDTISRLVGEKSEIVNTALRSSQFAAMMTGAPQRYIAKNIELGEVKLNFTKAPLEIKIEFKEKKNPEFETLIISIFNNVLNPLKQLNDESITNRELEIIDKYISQFFKLLTEKSDGATYKTVQKIIDSVTTEDTLEAKFFKNFMKRYYGLLLAPFIINSYFTKVKIVVDKLAGLTTTINITNFDNYAKYLIEFWQRRYCLGMTVLDADYQEQILSSVSQELDNYAVKSGIDTIVRNAMNNAIIHLDKLLGDGTEKLDSPEFLVDVQAQQLYDYAVKDFVGTQLNKISNKMPESYSSEFINRLMNSLPKISKQLFTANDFKEELARLTQLFSSVMTDQVTNVKKISLQAKITPFIMDTYIAVAGNIRYDDFLKENKIKSVDDFTNILTSLFPIKDKEKLATLPKPIAEFNSFEFLLRLSEVNSVTKNLSEGLESVGKDLKQELDTSGKVKLRWEFLAKNLKDFIIYWFKDFSGVVPEEIHIQLSTGIIFLKIESFKKLSFYAAFLENSNAEEAMDLGKYGELATNSIEDGVLVSKLRDR